MLLLNDIHSNCINKFKVDVVIKREGSMRDSHQLFLHLKTGTVVELTYKSSDLMKKDYDRIVWYDYEL